MRIGLACLVIVLASTAVALGCDNAPERRQACEARVARLEQTLASLPEPGCGGPVPEEIHPALTTAGTVLLDSMPTITVGARGELRLDGRALPNAAALATDLDTLRRHWGILHPGAAYPAVVHVWADRELTIAALRARLSVVRDHRIVVLAVDPSVRVALPPCPSSLGETCVRLPQLARRARTDELASVWRRALGRCEHLRALSTEVASASVRDRARVLRAGLPEALRACECGHSADEDAIEYIAAVALASPFDPAVRARDLPPPGDADESTTVGTWVGSVGG